MRAVAAYPSDETEAQTGDAMGSQEALRSADDRLIGPKKVARALGLADQGAGESGLQMARVFMRQELTCAALIALWLFFPADRGLAKGWLGLAAVLLAGQGLGVGMYRRPPGRRTWSLHLAIAVSLLGGAIYFSGTELSPVFLFYLWATAFASWYFPVRQVAAQVLWIVVSYAVVLVVHQDPGQAHWWQISNGDAVRWVLLAGTVTASALLLRTFRSMLADNEQRLLVAFERSATPMGLAGLNGRVLHANEAMGELLGRSSEELAGRAWRNSSIPLTARGRSSSLQADNVPDGSKSGCSRQTALRCGSTFQPRSSRIIVATPSTTSRRCWTSPLAGRQSTKRRLSRQGRPPSPISATPQYRARPSRR